MNIGFCGRMWKIFCWHTDSSVRCQIQYGRRTHNTGPICCKESWKECAWVGGELLPSQGEMISKSVLVMTRRGALYNRMFMPHFISSATPLQLQMIIYALHPFVSPMLLYLLLFSITFTLGFLFLSFLRVSQWPRTFISAFSLYCFWTSNLTWILLTPLSWILDKGQIRCV